MTLRDKCKALIDGKKLCRSEDNEQECVRLSETSGNLVNQYGDHVPEVKLLDLDEVYDDTPKFTFEEIVGLFSNNHNLKFSDADGNCYTSYTTGECVISLYRVSTGGSGVLTIIDIVRLAKDQSRLYYQI